MKLEFHFALVVASGFLLGACGGEQDTDVGTLQLKSVSTNGFSTNGFSTNGFSTNGWELGSETIAQAQLNDSVLSVTTRSGKTMSGSALTGLKISIPTDGGDDVKLRIDSVTQSSYGSFYEYGISLKRTGSWQSLCGPDPVTGDSASAVPLSGAYDEVTGKYTPDPSLFTFACTNAALGKCVRWGYAPWKTQQECTNSGSCKPRSLQNWHQACVFMVRADYCGDGVPHTRNGTLINLWDVLNIETQESTSWELEAEWTPSGAQCIRHTRWIKADPASATTDLDYVKQNCPQRLAVNQGSVCNPNTSNFFTQYGFGLDPSQRRLLRNQSALNQ